MVFEIQFSNEARLDIDEARKYYLKISDDLLKRFDNDIVETVERLRLNPQNFQKRYRNIKIVFTKKFPYGLHYLTENKYVYIQRFLHQKQYYK